MNFFPGGRHEEIFLQLSMCLRAVISQRLVRTISGKRVAAIEILRDTPFVKDLIKSGRVDEVKAGMINGSKGGCQTFDQALLHLYSMGKIDLEQAFANSDNPNDLRLKLQHADPSTHEEEQENEESEENFEKLFPPVEEWLLQEQAKPYKEVNGSEY